MRSPAALRPPWSPPITSVLAKTSSDAASLTSCDREPIHIPGAIQPHGLLLVVDAEGVVVGGAGDIEGRLAPEWVGRPLEDLLGTGVLGQILSGEPVQAVRGLSETFEAVAHRVGGRVLVELEPMTRPALTAAQVLSRLTAAAGAFDRTTSLQELCDRAAALFRDLTGYDRVLIYRFLDDGAGVVTAEAAASGMAAFLNHHFPATDIPRQARALYIRNRVRVIPNVGYAPAPLRPASAGLADLDLSDAALRSVSPVHLQYLKNMGVGASASVSIVKDGLLWGLVACHDAGAKLLPYDIRLACEALAGGLARQIRAKEEAEQFRDRIRVRTSEDVVLAKLGDSAALGSLFSDAGDELCRMMRADGFAAIQQGEVVSNGATPDRSVILRLASWIRSKSVQPFSTDALSQQYPEAVEFEAVASGVLAATIENDPPLTLLWFRAETLEVLNWAGNPHKAEARPGETLTPRASFEAWSETVRGRSAPWTLNERDAAGRLVLAIRELRQFQRISALNADLSATVTANERLLAQKDLLMKEVSHRVQNSLQMVTSFLALQARGAGDPNVARELEEAGNRVLAVALVHRRLYADERIDTIDLSRYIEDLIDQLRASMDARWRPLITSDLAPVLISADRAVNVGLILTELVINAVKYAYGGEPGPISIALELHRNTFRLIVADSGGGRTGARVGFGSRMLAAVVDRIGGELDESSNDPGMRVIVTAAADG